MARRFWCLIQSTIVATLAIQGCKPKEASPQLAQSNTANEKRFEWCKPSAAALESMLESLKMMDRTGRDSLTHATDGKKVVPTAPPRSALAMLSSTPPQNPPPCGQEFDNAMLSNSQMIAILSTGHSPEIALNAMGPGCQVQTPSGILAVTKMKDGAYMVELMGCGGRTRSEMIMPKDDLLRFARSILRGV